MEVLDDREELQAMQLNYSSQDCSWRRFVPEGKLSEVVLHLFNGLRSQADEDSSLAVWAGPIKTEVVLNDLEKIFWIVGKKIIKPEIYEQ